MYTISRELDMSTVDDGGVYLATKSRGEFVLAVQHDETECEVVLDRVELARIAVHAGALLLHDEVEA